jgi:hypothetical protein
MMARLVLLLLVVEPVWADSSGHRKLNVVSEQLGNLYSYIGQHNDRGLEVEEWWNETLDRQELWYKPGTECFLKINNTTYVLGIHHGGQWKTNPTVKLVNSSGEWKRSVLVVQH